MILFKMSFSFIDLSKILLLPTFAPSDDAVIKYWPNVCFRENNKISVFSVKVALATLCAGKLMDKFRCKYIISMRDENWTCYRQLTRMHVVYAQISTRKYRIATVTWYTGDSTNISKKFLLWLRQFTSHPRSVTRTAWPIRYFQRWAIVLFEKLFFFFKWTDNMKFLFLIGYLKLNFCDVNKWFFDDSMLTRILCVQNTKVTVNDFLDTLMSEPGPHCLIWLPLYHRMAAVESGNADTSTSSPLMKWLKSVIFNEIWWVLMKRR